MENLNEFLVPQSSPMARNQGGMTPYDFDTRYERGAVSNAKIDTIQFNKLYGGTAVLGGTANGNGYMEVKDASGGTIVQVNNNGITVTGGSISVTNSLGSSIMDASGLVSSNNFPKISTFYGSLTNITGTAYTTLNNSSGTIVLLRDTNFIFSLVLILSSSESVGNECTGVTFISIGGVNVNSAAIFFGGNGSSGGQRNRTYSNTYFASLPAGTTVVSLQSRLENLSGTAKMTINEYTLSYMQLGS